MIYFLNNNVWYKFSWHLLIYFFGRVIYLYLNPPNLGILSFLSFLCVQSSYIDTILCAIILGLLANRYYGHPKNLRILFVKKVSMTALVNTPLQKFARSMIWTPKMLLNTKSLFFDHQFCNAMYWYEFFDLTHFP